MTQCLNCLHVTPQCQSKVHTLVFFYQGLRAALLLHVSLFPNKNVLVLKKKAEHTADRELVFHYITTDWCLLKGHFSPAAVPVGWACVLTIRGCLDSAATCRWRRVVCQRLRWPFPQVHVIALSRTGPISGSSRPQPDAHCSFISHLRPLFTQQAVAPRLLGAAIISGG